MTNRPTLSVLVAACGAPALASDAPPQALGPEHLGRGEVAGHIYVNAATGERIVTLDRPEPRPRGLPSGTEPVWMADNDGPCAAYGLPGRLIAPLDRPDVSPSDSAYPYSTGALVVDWGDIASDTVIDAVGVSFATRHPDTDADGDGFADGVEGLGASWTWMDDDNGGDYCGAFRYPLVTVTLSDLPGDLDQTDGLYATWFITIDMKGGFDEDNSFELGDTDHDPQSAAHHNPGRFHDWDGDGLHDFSFNVRFHQPGTMDFDGDGVPDGDPKVRARAGAVLVAPEGPIVPHPSIDGVYTVDPVDPPPAAQGLEDMFDFRTGDFDVHVGTFWYGGFSCDHDGNGVPGDRPDDYNPFASFYQRLYSPSTGPLCPADLFPAGGDGQLNFFDVSSFITLFNAMDPAADFFPTGGDGQFNFFDVSAYMSAFNAGCP